MKLVNKTPYGGRELRRIITATYRDVEEQKGPLRSWETRDGAAHLSRLRLPSLNIQELVITVVVANGRQRNLPYGGCASYNGRTMRLRVPTPKLEVLQLVALVRHELWHSYGAKHADFPPGVMRCVPSDRDRAIVDRLGLGAAVTAPEVEPKPAVDLTQIRYERLLKREATWAGKLQRAQRALTKIRQSKRGYEQRLAARKPPTEAS